MTNKEKYIQLCQQEDLPLHAQAWWWERSTVGKKWDAIIIEEENRVLAATPYHISSKWGLRAILMPVHTQYHCVYIAPKAPSNIYERIVQALETTCQQQHIGWIQLQGFYPSPLLDAFRAHNFASKERVTYRIETIPSPEELPASFSENKRRQLRKANELHLADLPAEQFYAFHRNCMEAQGKKIDYPTSWAQAVLPEAIKRHHGRLIAAQNKENELLAAMFLAWDHQYGYYLLPTYQPAYKNSGAVAWLTAQALGIIREKGLSFDFEGSMTPSIASSYQQFGGQPTTYLQIEKFYNPLLRIAVKIRKQM